MSNEEENDDIKGKSTNSGSPQFPKDRFEYRSPIEDGYSYLPDTRNSDRRRRPSGSGCFIATVCYGSYESEEVRILRNYRDQKLSNTIIGRMFIRIYYSISPRLASFIADRKLLKRFIKSLLEILVNKIKTTNK